MIPLEGVMRDLRFSGFLLVAVLSSAAWTQVQNPATTQQPAVVQAPVQTPATAPAALATQNEKLKDPPKREYFRLRVIPQKPQRNEKRTPIGSLDREFVATIQSGTIERKVIDPFQVAEDFRKEMDHGIRLSPAGAGMCGSIVSYNFSPGAPGEVPHLESVTTCTPADKVVQRRAQNSGRKPSPPQLLKTSSPERKP
jgi:hypothetical protein